MTLARRVGAILTALVATAGLVAGAAIPATAADGGSIAARPAELGDASDGAIDPAAPAPAPMVVTGSLVDENGLPIPKVEVSLFGGVQYRVMEDLGEGYSWDWNDVQWVEERAVTAKDGSFRLTVTFPQGADLIASDAASLYFTDPLWQFAEIPVQTLAFTAGPVPLGSIRLNSVPNPGRYAKAVNTKSKAAVRKLYRAGFEKQVRQEKRVKVKGCSVASTPKAQQNRELTALNTFRSLAGLAPVTLSASLSKKASAAALIQFYQGGLSHYPSPKARCATKVGVETSGRSNLSYGWSTGAANVLGYMHDPGSNNRAAGHRGWFLTPGLTKVGTGWAESFNAFYVVSPMNSKAATPQWVTWPTAGFFPAELEPYGRWSFTTTRMDMDFAKAKVTMTVAGKKRKLSLYRDAGGGQVRGLAWDVAKPIVVKGKKTVTAKVTVSGVKLRGTTMKPIVYTVKLFNAGTKR